jgi:hypothetical protein
MSHFQSITDKDQPGVGNDHRLEKEKENWHADS